jgi:hypothetical protein
MTFSAKQARWNGIKNAIRSRYAWPGGYPLYIVMSDGEALSIDAARENYKLLCAAYIRGDKHDSWLAEGANINYEDENLFCIHTGEKIESAYVGEDF